MEGVIFVVSLPFSLHWRSWVKTQSAFVVFTHWNYMGGKIFDASLDVSLSRTSSSLSLCSLLIIYTGAYRELLIPPDMTSLLTQVLNTWSRAISQLETPGKCRAGNTSEIALVIILRYSHVHLNHSISRSQSGLSVKYMCWCNLVRRDWWRSNISACAGLCAINYWV